MSTREQMNELIQKWEKAGLLDELSDPKKEGCSMDLEDMARLLVTEEYKDHRTGDNDPPNEVDKAFDIYGGWYAGMVLPLVRRLYTESSNFPRLPKAYWLNQDFKSFLIENKNIERVEDWEVVLVEKYVKKIVNVIKDI